MTLLIVEDDPAISRVISHAAQQHGHTVLSTSTAEEGWDLLQTRGVDFVVIDLTLPHQQGGELVTNIRRISTVPIIVVSAITNLERRVALLQRGADDYLVKPFEPVELLARIDAVSRRLVSHKAPNRTLCFGPYTFVAHEKSLRKNTDTVALTASEFTLLEALLEYPGRVYSREQLLDRIHGWADGSPTHRIIDVHIAALRAKIERDSKKPYWIETVWGMGYRFRRDVHEC